MDHKEITLDYIIRCMDVNQSNGLEPKMSGFEGYFDIYATKRYANH